MTPTEDTTSSEAEKPAQASHASTNILNDVADKILLNLPQVRERVVNALVEQEVALRVSVLDKALAKRSDQDREIRKLARPDVETFDAEGKVTSTSFTKARVDELKKAKEQQEKLEKAIDKALLSGDFSKLKEIVGSSIK